MMGGEVAGESAAGRHDGPGEALSGWLQKLDEKKIMGKKHYRKCWFVLSRENDDYTLSHYEHSTLFPEYVGAERLARGERNVSRLSDINRVRFLGSNGMKFEVSFKDPDSPPLILRAVNEDVAKRWVYALMDLLSKDVPEVPSRPKQKQPQQHEGAGAEEDEEFEASAASETKQQSTMEKRRERQSVKVAAYFLQDSEIFMTKARTFTTQVRQGTNKTLNRTLERKKKKEEKRKALEEIDDDIDLEALPPPPPEDETAPRKGSGPLQALFGCKKTKKLDKKKQPKEDKKSKKKTKQKEAEKHQESVAEEEEEGVETESSKTHPKPRNKSPSFKEMDVKKANTLNTSKKKGKRLSMPWQASMDRKAATIHGDETLKRKNRNMSALAMTPKAKSGHNAKVEKEEKGPRLAVLPMMGRKLNEVKTFVKTDSTASLIKETIETSISLSGMLFEDLDQSALNSLVEKMYRVDVPEGEDVIRQKEVGDKFYVIEKGRFHVYMQRGEGANGLPELVAEKGPRTFFGELALLYEQPAAVTVRAVTDGVLWAIDRYMFFEIRKAQARKRQARKLRLLSNIDLLADNLQERDIIALAEAMEETVYEKGEVILDEGKPLQKVLIVATGLVDVHTKSEKIGNLHSGEAFGEWALLEKASKTDVKLIAGADNTTTLTLDVEEFEGLVGSLRTLLEYKWAESVGKLFPDVALIRSESVGDQRRTSAERPKSTLGKRLSSIRRKDRSSTQFSSVRSSGLDEVDIKNAEAYVNRTLAEIKSQYAHRKSTHFKDSALTTETKSSSIPSSDEDDGKSAIHQDWDNCPVPCESVGLDDLLPCARLGKGSFGRVHLVRNQRYGDIMYENSRGEQHALPKYMALKVLSRHFIVSNGWEEMVENERAAMTEVGTYTDCPFIVKLYSAFYDQRNIYFLLEVCDGADLYQLVRKQPQPRLKEKAAKFYVASVILGLMAIHSRNIVYRDLKPENLMICDQGYIRIADFGLAKKTLRTFTVCGTPDYMAPEIILGRGHDAAVDWWAVGVLIFELTTSVVPFPGREPMDIYESVLAHQSEGDLVFPDFAPISGDAKSIIAKLLQPKTTKRLGVVRSGLKDHAFFKGFQWDKLENMTLKPPIKIKPRNVSKYEHPEFENFNKYDPMFHEAKEDRSPWVPNI